MKPVPSKNQLGKPLQKKPQANQPQKKQEVNFRLPDSTKWTIVCGLIVFTFILYGNSIMHNYALDDDIITRKNEFVQQGVKGIGQIFHKGFLYGFNRANDQSYRPITLASIAIEVALWKENPHVHHFFNVFWYALTSVFLFLTLVKIFRKYNYIVPLLITLLFIAHPIHTEVVANIKSRDEILSFMFCILSINFAWDYFQLKKSWIYLFISSVAFFAATLSKEQSIVFVSLIPLVFYFFSDFTLNLKGRFGFLGSLYERLPFFIINWKKLVSLNILSIPYNIVVLLYSIIRARTLDSFTFSEKMQVINNSLMAAHNNSDKIATATFVMGKYLLLLIFPHPLSWDYSYNQIPIHTWSDIGSIISISIYIALWVYALIRFRKKDIYAFCIFYFFMTMSLVSNLFISIGSSMGERFLYTPSLAFCIAITFIILKVLKIDLSPSRKLVVKPVVYWVFGVILLAGSVKTIARNSDWKDNFTLFETGISAASNSARAHQALAITYTDTANHCSDPVQRNMFFNKAIPEYYAALRILPDYSEALYNLGWNYYSMQEFDSAAIYFTKCIAADPMFINAYNDLGVIYFNKKNYPMAISIFKSALLKAPNDPNMLENIGAAYYNINRFDSCIYYSRQALNIDPGLNSARENLSKAQSVMSNQKH